MIAITYGYLVIINKIKNNPLFKNSPISIQTI